jgi:hypothetical protein
MEFLVSLIESRPIFNIGTLWVIYAGFSTKPSTTQGNRLNILLIIPENRKQKLIRCLAQLKVNALKKYFSSLRENLLNSIPMPKGHGIAVNP